VRTEAKESALRELANEMFLELAQRIATSAPESEAGVLVVGRHHLLVRYSHWLNVPILQL
jgi:hypothetical protein